MAKKWVGGMESLGARITRGDPGNGDPAVGGPGTGETAAKLSVAEFIQQVSQKGRADAPPEKPGKGKEQKAWKEFLGNQVMMVIPNNFRAYDRDAFESAMKTYASRRFTMDRGLLLDQILQEVDNNDDAEFERLSAALDERLVLIGCELPGGAASAPRSEKVTETEVPGMTEEELMAGLEGYRGEPEKEEGIPGDSHIGNIDPEQLEGLYRGVDVSRIAPEGGTTGEEKLDSDELAAKLKEAFGNLAGDKKVEVEQKPGAKENIFDRLRKEGKLGRSPAPDTGSEALKPNGEDEILRGLEELAKRAKAERAASSSYERPKDLPAGFTEWPVFKDGKEQRLVISADGKLRAFKDLKAGDRERLLLIGSFKEYDPDKKYEAVEVEPETEEELQERLQRVGDAMTYFNERVQEGADATLMFQLVAGILPEADREAFREALLDNNHDVGTIKLEDQADFIGLGHTEKEVAKKLGQKDGDVAGKPYWYLPDGSIAVLDRMKLAKNEWTEQPHLQVVRLGGYHRLPRHEQYINDGGKMREMTVKEIAAAKVAQEKALEEAIKRGDAVDWESYDAKLKKLRAKERREKSSRRNKDIDEALRTLREKEAQEEQPKGEKRKGPDTRREPTDRDDADQDDRTETSADNEDVPESLVRKYGKPTFIGEAPIWTDPRDRKVVVTYDIRYGGDNRKTELKIRPGGVHHFGDDPYINKAGKLVRMSSDAYEAWREQGRERETHERRETRREERTLEQAKDIYWDRREKDGLSIGAAMADALKGLSKKDRRALHEYLVERGVTKGIADATLERFEARLRGKDDRNEERETDRRGERLERESDDAYETFDDLYDEGKDNLQRSYFTSTRGMSVREIRKFIRRIRGRRDVDGRELDDVIEKDQRLRGEHEERPRERGERREDRREEREPQEDRPRSREDRQVENWQNEVDKYFKE